MTGLDIQIHRVFAAVESATEDEEAAQTLELMEGIVILSGIVHAIAEARLGSGAPDPVITASGRREFHHSRRGIQPWRKGHIHHSSYRYSGSVHRGFSAQRTNCSQRTLAFQAAGPLPLGAGVFTLEATGAGSRLQAVAPVVVVDRN